MGRDDTASAAVAHLGQPENRGLVREPIRGCAVGVATIAPRVATPPPDRDLALDAAASG